MSMYHVHPVLHTLTKNNYLLPGLLSSTICNLLFPLIGHIEEYGNHL